MSEVSTSSTGEQRRLDRRGAERDGRGREHESTIVAATAEQETPDWFKSAVFYEVLVRSFRDSNADGTGDFRGVIEKLDYLQWLGIDCLWVPPFFTSPLRDGGYDVADYTSVLPEVGMSTTSGSSSRQPTGAASG